MGDAAIIGVQQSSILIIDEDLSSGTLLKKLLQRIGYSNVVLESDANQITKQVHRQKPTLIILDFDAIKHQTFKPLLQLNDVGTAVKASVLVISSILDKSFKLHCLTQGAKDFLQKPFDSLELQARVRNILEAHLAHSLLKDEAITLERLVSERTAELRLTRLKVIQRLGRAAEYRDNETGAHIIRMSRYSMLIARKLGMDYDECEMILEASPMHDVGKIGIPDKILLKPGKLTQQEFEVMKCHPEIGANLLDDDDSVLLKAARAIALAHHEKWDGSGYPYGLKGDEIPIEARIVAVADVFDALTSSRPYKRAWDCDEALRYIRREAGRHFDPRVVDAFVGSYEEILKVREQNSDSPLKDINSKAVSEQSFGGDVNV